MSVNYMDIVRKHNIAQVEQFGTLVWIKDEHGRPFSFHYGSSIVANMVTNKLKNMVGVFK